MLSFKKFFDFPRGGGTWPHGPPKYATDCSTTARRESLGERGCDIDSGTTLQMRLSISLSFCSLDTLFVKFPAIYAL